MKLVFFLLLQTIQILKEIGPAFFIENINSNSETYVNAVEYFVQVVLNVLAGMDAREGKKADKKLMQG